MVQAAGRGRGRRQFLGHLEILAGAIAHQGFQGLVGHLGAFVRLGRKLFHPALIHGQAILVALLDVGRVDPEEAGNPFPGIPQVGAGVGHRILALVGQDQAVVCLGHLDHDLALLEVHSGLV